VPGEFGPESELIVPQSSWLQNGLSDAASKLMSSIAVRLATVVLVTGSAALVVIGGLTMLRLDVDLKEQSDALYKLSEHQLVYRLEGEAHLSRARLNARSAQLSRDLRQFALNPKLESTLAAGEPSAIADTLEWIAKSEHFDAIYFFTSDGRLASAFPNSDLARLEAAMRQTEATAPVLNVLADNKRSNPRGIASARPLPAPLLLAAGRAPTFTVADEAIEPVFDSHGNVAGALLARRIFRPTESIFKNVSGLINAGIVIMRDGQVISAAGPPNVSFPNGPPPDHALWLSRDGIYVARCIAYEAAMQICAFADRDLIARARDQLVGVNEAQTRGLMWQFLVFAAIVLVMLVSVLLVSVRRCTRGLSRLASAAVAVANGNLDAPFKASGIGEVFSLGLAFERMLANLRGSMGRIRQLAFYDTVTGLPNREKLRLDASGIIAEAKVGAFFFLDLDGFKPINDTFGHKTGDALLAKVASRLSAFVASHDRVLTEVFPLARVGGDEFAAIFPGVSSQEKAAALAEEIIALVHQPFEVGGAHMTVGASIGITLFPDDGRSYEDLLINADLAMYAAKSKGRNTYAFFTREIAEVAKERLAIESELKKAVQDEALEVYYQPQVSCHDGRIRGVEALVRWNHPRLGWLAPAKFIGVAEETGLIAEIGRFVLRTALRDIGSLIATGTELVVSVNSSALEIEDALFANSVRDIVKASAFPATCLQLEITESMAMHDPEIVSERIESLRELGVRFAIDDFGTGYSNLATLARLPFDTVKLDRSLISGIATNFEKQSIVRITLDLAKELGFDTVVEGVEMQYELRFVADAGATMAQGFLFSPAVPISDLAALVQPASLGKVARLSPPPGRPRQKRAAVGG
jgi:diguanylate cyclase (GGDEF)-like protein